MTISNPGLLLGAAAVGAAYFLYLHSVKCLPAVGLDQVPAFPCCRRAERNSRWVNPNQADDVRAVKAGQ